MVWLGWIPAVGFQRPNCLLWILHAQEELNYPQSISQCIKDVDTRRVTGTLLDVYVAVLTNCIF